MKAVKAPKTNKKILLPSEYENDLFDSIQNYLENPGSKNKPETTVSRGASQKSIR